MKKIIVLIILVVVGWQGYARYQQRTAFAAPAEETMAPAHTAGSDGLQQTGNWRCDGRTHCSQMTSCAEARFFLAHCPDVKMDGNNDGEPCEQQWCH
ncbi:hypothetical protein IGB42_02975 [Andreprevotia sp. IGB-42]|uniref:excalibur calcium-binding domain-containing protein n=1 Tax=Andreprevotia sp. IGB-42 TaxID=2497473 RepID=UPI0013567ECF|nr:excalibur calcium-binding domain-containing protein [Andreprevotia sp. IGB-42]KAF0812683.1 hypothetical protein IGB42_02975 [Andreprevotia sp. IGB-42]